MKSYSQVIAARNKQGIFDRQFELCRHFIELNSNSSRFFNYNVSNNCILIQVSYEKHSDWSAVEGKRILQKLLEKYRFHLLGYEPQKIYYTRSVNLWNRFKLVCEYTILLNILKFDISTFYYSKDYLSYKKGNFSKFELF